MQTSTAPTSPSRFRRRGVPGNTGKFGYAETGEYLKLLEGDSGRKIFDEMRRSDAQVQSMLRACKLPILRTRFYMEPASEDKTDVIIAKIIEDNLLKELHRGWYDTLRHILLYFDFGFSIVEDLFEYRGGLMKIRDLDPRLPQSLYRWEPEELPDPVDPKRKRFRLKGITQIDTYGQQYFIPIENITIFSNDREGDNWEGVSILRSAYKHWKLKGMMETVDGQKHERTGVGIPVMTAPDGVSNTSAEWLAAEELVRNIHANEQEGIVKGFGWEFEIATAKGNATDVLPSIKYHDEQMARCVLAMFLQLGTSSTGSRALGDAFIDFFYDSLQTQADYVADILTKGPIRKMVELNWAGAKVPCLKAGPVADLDALTVSELSKTGVITPDEAIENAARRRLNLPDLEGKRPVVAVQPIAAHAHVHKKNFQATPREPNKWESICDIRFATNQLDEKQVSVEMKVLAIRESQIRDLAEQVAAGVKIHRIKIPLQKEMMDLLMQTYNEQSVEGRRQVAEEIRRQAAMKLAKPKKGAKVILIEDELNLLVTGAGSKLASTISQFGIDGRRSGLAGEQLDLYLMNRAKDEVSTQTWNNMVSKAVNQGWGDGRDAEAREQGVDVGYYSSIMDSNRCDVCEQTQISQDMLPGGFHEVGDPEFVAPNPNCEGGDKCRCLVIYVTGI